MLYRLSRRCAVIVLFLLMAFGLQANNVRIRGDVRVLSRSISNPENVAPIRFTVEWDNSWRDMFNYDAVYVFLKYKINEPGEQWHHLYLMNEGNAAASGYDLELVNNTSSVNKNEGFFLYRSTSNPGAGPASVSVDLRWLINSNPDRPLTIADFEQEKVLLVAMAMEMVYVPRGAFRVGDTYSAKHFRTNYLPMPEKYDLISSASNVRTSSPLSPDYPDPILPANRVNDLSTAKHPRTQQPTNAWYGDKTGTGTGEQFWVVEFESSKRVRYMAIESVPGYVPTEWYLEGQTSLNSDQWELIYTGNGEEWETSLTRTYPPTRAFRVNYPNLKAYVAYRIRVPQSKMPNGASGNPPLIRNVSMTEEDLSELVDRSVIISEPTTNMGGQVYLAAEDGEEWTGTTHENYPNGYPAFYAMKYEISQDQYVAFLNKLRPEQQRARTIGYQLSQLNLNDYVFGGNPTGPACRNGIRLIKYSVDNEPMVFDSRTPMLACNYLSIADMLAYADWTGLRPMTELEYEKMCRPFLPMEPMRGEFPWNSLSFKRIQGLQNNGSRTERPTNGDANVNFGAVLQGPLRVGALASGATNWEETGVTFWGIMEAGGNLAELYYNANLEGRKYRGIANNLHGDGRLNAAGNTDISLATWPTYHRAFCLKGGHWADTDSSVLFISDRSRHIDIIPSGQPDYRDSTVTFRLAHTAKQNTFPAHLVLQNGLTTENGTAADTVCDGSVYVIRGELPVELQDDYTSSVWFVSENQGKSWELMEGESEQHLEVRKLWNINTNEDVVQEYWFKKEIYGLSGDAKTDVAVLRVLNDTTYVSAFRDTLDVYDHSQGITVSVDNAADFRWTFNGEAKEIAHVVRAGKTSTGAPRYVDCEPGDGYYVVRSVFHPQCEMRDTIELYVHPKPNERQSDLVECGEIMIDARDGKRYRTVLVRAQCWMADNLDYVVAGSRCYNDIPANCAVYGRLYNWEQAVGEWTTAMVQGICPKGWHLPNQGEWLQLQNVEGRELRSQLNLWQFASQAALANNNSRFSALPSGGYFFSYSASLGRNGYFDAGTKGWWWTSSYASGGKWASHSSATMDIPIYATLDHNNNRVVSTTGTGSVFYDASLLYLGNSSSYSAVAKYNAQVAVRSQFFFGVRCVQDVK